MNFYGRVISLHLALGTNIPFQKAAQKVLRRPKTKHRMQHSFKEGTARQSIHKGLAGIAGVGGTMYAKGRFDDIDLPGEGVNAPDYVEDPTPPVVKERIVLTEAEKYQCCKDRQWGTWDLETGDQFKFKDDKKFAEMAHEYCVSVHMKVYENDDEKRADLKKQLRVMKDYQYEQARQFYGEAQQVKDYEMIYEDMKSDNWELEQDNKKMVANIDKCIADGGNLYVSFHALS